LTESWKAGKLVCVKTTIDLPVELVREMKLRAVRDGRKLKEVAAEILRRGLESQDPIAKPELRHKIVLPLIQCAFDAPASRMKVEEIIAQEQESQTIEDLNGIGMSL
jgi:plasmid stability protein